MTCSGTKKFEYLGLFSLGSKLFLGSSRSSLLGKESSIDTKGIFLDERNGCRGFGDFIEKYLILFPSELAGLKLLSSENPRKDLIDSLTCRPKVDNWWMMPGLSGISSLASPTLRPTRLAVQTQIAVRDSRVIVANGRNGLAGLLLRHSTSRETSF